MAQKSINLDHTNGVIYTTDDSVIRLGNHGAVKFGDGSNIARGDSSNIGAIRFRQGNDFTDSYYEMHNGSDFQKLVQPVDPINAIIFAIIFS